MIFKIVAVFDGAIQGYGTPFFIQSDNAAVRSFKNEVNNSGSPFASNPDDYELYVVGAFDTEDGSISSNGPMLLARGKDLVTDF